MAEISHDGASPSGVGEVARQLLTRIESDESLEEVVSAVVDSMDRLTSTELSELLVALGTRWRRERAVSGSTGPPSAPQSDD
jgi:hypothetical protein